MKKRLYYETVPNSIIYGVGYDHEEVGFAIFFGFFIPWIVKPMSIGIGIKLKPNKNGDSTIKPRAKERSFKKSR